jgi:hypothetical protein
MFCSYLTSFLVVLLSLFVGLGSCLLCFPYVSNVFFVLFDKVNLSKKRKKKQLKKSSVIELAGKNYAYMTEPM